MKHHELHEIDKEKLVDICSEFFLFFMCEAKILIRNDRTEKETRDAAKQWVDIYYEKFEKSRDQK